MQPLARLRFRATKPVATAQEGPDFLEVAPFRTRVVYDFPDYSPDELWAVASGARMWSWLPTVWGCRYPDGEEVGPGTVRDFQMYLHHWLIYAQREKILVWEPGVRLMYTATDATLPFFGTWCEEYRVESRAGGSRLVWTMGVRVRFLEWMPMRWLTPVMQAVFRFGLRGLHREVGDGIHATERTVG